MTTFDKNWEDGERIWRILGQCRRRKTCHRKITATTIPSRLWARSSSKIYSFVFSLSSTLLALACVTILLIVMHSTARMELGDSIFEGKSPNSASEVTHHVGIPETPISSLRSFSSKLNELLLSLFSQSTTRRSDDTTCCNMSNQSKPSAFPYFLQNSSSVIEPTSQLASSALLFWGLIKFSLANEEDDSALKRSFSASASSTSSTTTKITMAFSATTLLSGKLTDCHASIENNPCQGGLAALLAIGREYKQSGKADAVLTIPEIDVSTPFAQMHPRGLSVNIDVFSHVGIDTYTLKPSMLSSRASSSYQRLYTERVSPLMTNVNLEPSDDWYAYMKYRKIIKVPIANASSSASASSSSSSSSEIKVGLLYITPSQQQHSSPSVPVLRAALAGLRRDSDITVVLFQDRAVTGVEALTQLLEGVVSQSSGGSTSSDLIPDVLIDVGSKSAPTYFERMDIALQSVDSAKQLFSPQSEGRSFAGKWFGTAQIDKFAIFVNLDVETRPSSSPPTSLQLDLFENVSVPSATMDIVELKLMDSSLKDEAYYDLQRYLRNLSSEASFNDPQLTTVLEPASPSRVNSVYPCFAGECAQGTLASRALAWAFDADFAFVNSGGPRGPGWDAGPLRTSDVWALYTFSNTPCVGTVMGLKIWELVNASMAYCTFSDVHSSTADRFLQTYGLEIEYDKGPVSVAAGTRVRSIRVLNRQTNVFEPLDRLKYYSFATDSFHCSGVPVISDIILNLRAGESVNPSLNDNLVQLYLQDFLRAHDPYTPLFQNYLKEKPVVTLGGGVSSSSASSYTKQQLASVFMLWNQNALACGQYEKWDQVRESCVACASGFIRDTANAENCVPEPNDSELVVILVPVAVVSIFLIVTVISIVFLWQFFTKVRDNAKAPKGDSATIMFTDVQMSTQMWGTVPASMAVALDQHHALIRAAIRKYGGYEVKTVGDSFMIAVSSGEKAAELAVAIQNDFAEASWPRCINQVYAAQNNARLSEMIEDNPDDLIDISSPFSESEVQQEEQAPLVVMEGHGITNDNNVQEQQQQPQQQRFQQSTSPLPNDAKEKDSPPVAAQKKNSNQPDHRNDNNNGFELADFPVIPIEGGNDIHGDDNMYGGRGAVVASVNFPIGQKTSPFFNETHGAKLQDHGIGDNSTIMMIGGGGDGGGRGHHQFTHSMPILQGGMGMQGGAMMMMNARNNMNNILHQNRVVTDENSPPSDSPLSDDHRAAVTNKTNDKNPMLTREEDQQQQHLPSNPVVLGLHSLEDESNKNNKHNNGFENAKATTTSAAAAAAGMGVREDDENAVLMLMNTRPNFSPQEISLPPQLQRRDLLSAQHPTTNNNNNSLGSNKNKNVNNANNNNKHNKRLFNGLRIRIGIHHGPVAAVFDEVAKGYDYYGNTVNVAARLESIGFGGQIIISKNVADQLISSASHLSSTSICGGGEEEKKKDGKVKENGIFLNDDNVVDNDGEKGQELEEKQNLNKHDDSANPISKTDPILLRDNRTASTAAATTTSTTNDVTPNTTAATMTASASMPSPMSSLGAIPKLISAIIGGSGGGGGKEKGEENLPSTAAPATASPNGDLSSPFSPSSSFIPINSRMGIKALGMVQLKGVEVSMEVFQLIPTKLSDRVFGDILMKKLSTDVDGCDVGSAEKSENKGADENALATTTLQQINSGETSPSPQKTTTLNNNKDNANATITMSVETSSSTTHTVGRSDLQISIGGIRGGYQQQQQQSLRLATEATILQALTTSLRPLSAVDKAAHLLALTKAWRIDVPANANALKREKMVLSLVSQRLAAATVQRQRLGLGLGGVSSFIKGGYHVGSVGSSGGVVLPPQPPPLPPLPHPPPPQVDSRRDSNNTNNRIMVLADRNEDSSSLILGVGHGGGGGVGSAAVGFSPPLSNSRQNGPLSSPPTPTSNNIITPTTRSGAGDGGVHHHGTLHPLLLMAVSSNPHPGIQDNRSGAGTNNMMTTTMGHHHHFRPPPITTITTNEASEEKRIPTSLNDADAHMQYDGRRRGKGKGANGEENDDGDAESARVVNPLAL